MMQVNWNADDAIIACPTCDMAVFIPIRALMKGRRIEDYCNVCSPDRE